MITYRSTNRFVDAFRAFEVMRGLDAYYPDFDEWFVNKAVPGIVAGTDGLILAEDGSRIVGVALWKETPEETKLRCVRVLPSHRRRGVGLRLIDRALAAMKLKRPVFSVAEEMIHEYARIFVNRYGFTVTKVEKGLYRPGRLEYVFNGGLHAKSAY